MDETAVQPPPLPKQRLKLTYAQAVRRGVKDSLVSVSSYTLLLIASLVGTVELAEEKLTTTLPALVHSGEVDGSVLKMMPAAEAQKITVIAPQTSPQFLFRMRPDYKNDISREVPAFASKSRQKCEIYIGGVFNQKVIDNRKKILMGVYDIENMQDISSDEIKLYITAHEIGHCLEKSNFKRPDKMDGHPLEEAIADKFAIEEVEKRFPNSKIRKYVLAFGSQTNNAGHSVLATNAVLAGEAIPELAHIVDAHNLVTAQHDTLERQVRLALTQTQKAKPKMFANIMPKHPDGSPKFEVGTASIVADIILANAADFAKVSPLASRIFKLRVEGYKDFYPERYKQGVQLAKLFEGGKLLNTPKLRWTQPL
ncbi:MAG: hypothetical protein KGQ41_01550 [Alphaproteobacteria bacterium]|nr:hypothetical protein [Alphaproteobacteria bacterium]